MENNLIITEDHLDQIIDSIYQKIEFRINNYKLKGVWFLESNTAEGYNKIIQNPVHAIALFKQKGNVILINKKFDVDLNTYSFEFKKTLVNNHECFIIATFYPIK